MTETALLSFIVVVGLIVVSWIVYILVDHYQTKIEELYNEVAYWRLQYFELREKCSTPEPYTQEDGNEPNGEAL